MYSTYHQLDRQISHEFWRSLLSKIYLFTWFARILLLFSFWWSFVMNVLLSNWIVSPLFDWPTLPMWPNSDWCASHAIGLLVHVGVVKSVLIKMDETKVIYHIDDEDTPYLVKLPKSPSEVTLSDFKNVLNRPSYKFFFKSMDDDFGWVDV